MAEALPERGRFLTLKDCGKRLDGNARAGCLCGGCSLIRRRKKEQMRAYRAKRNRERRAIDPMPVEQALHEVHDLVS